MEKLIAARPIQYMGRTYESGDAVPAYDGKMVEAWLAAGSVKWAGADVAEPAKAETATPEAVLAAAAEMAADTLQGMGVTLADKNGFLGVNSVAELIGNITAAVMNAPRDAQEGQNGVGGHEHAEDQDGEPGGQQAAGEPEMVEGHLDAEDLEKTMTREQLNTLAADMGLDVSACKNKGEVAALIAAAPVQAPKNENGGAQ